MQHNALARVKGQINNALTDQPRNAHYTDQWGYGDALYIRAAPPPLLISLTARHTWILGSLAAATPSGTNSRPTTTPSGGEQKYEFAWLDVQDSVVSAAKTKCAPVHTSTSSTACEP